MVEMKVNRQTLVYAGIFLCWFIFQGCTTKITNITDTPIQSYQGTRLSLGEIRQAIIKAGHQKRWVMNDNKPGELTARFNPGKYSVEVAIPYSTKNYSILYRTSTGLKANGKKIHRTYKKLINELQNAIRTGITLAHHRPASKPRKKSPASPPPQQKAPPTIEVKEPPKQEGPSMDEFADWLRQVEKEEADSASSSAASQK